MKKAGEGLEGQAFTQARDAEAGAISFRFRDGTQRNGVPVAEAVEQIAAWVAARRNESPSERTFSVAAP